MINDSLFFTDSIAIALDSEISQILSNKIVKNIFNIFSIWAGIQTSNLWCYRYHKGLNVMPQNFWPRTHTNPDFTLNFYLENSCYFKMLIIKIWQRYLLKWITRYCKKKNFTTIYVGHTSIFVLQWPQIFQIISL